MAEKPVGACDTIQYTMYNLTKEYTTVFNDMECLVFVTHFMNLVFRYLFPSCNFDDVKFGIIRSTVLPIIALVNFTSSHN